MKKKDDEVQEIRSKATTLQTEVQKLREQHSQHEQVQGHFLALLQAYRNIRFQIEGAVRGTAKMPDSVEHEDQIIGRAADQVLQSCTV